MPKCLKQDPRYLKHSSQRCSVLSIQGSIVSFNAGRLNMGMQDTFKRSLVESW
jgi:hypothetical protein